MAFGAISTTVSVSRQSPQQTYRPGDLVATRTGYPVLYEILSLEPEGLVRVRGVNWAPGYNAVLSRQSIRPANRILAG